MTKAITFVEVEHSCAATTRLRWEQEVAEQRWQLGKTAANVLHRSLFGLATDEEYALARERERDFKPKPCPPAIPDYMAPIEVYEGRSVSHGDACLLTRKGIQALLDAGVRTIRTGEGPEPLVQLLDRAPVAA